MATEDTTVPEAATEAATAAYFGRVPRDARTIERMTQALIAAIPHLTDISRPPGPAAPVAGGPSEYELWRDALLIAAEHHRISNGVGWWNDVERMADRFVRPSLRQQGPRSACLACDEGGGFDHANDCPYLLAVADKVARGL